MKKINRSELRGKPLYKNCSKAKRTTNEYGPQDNRIFCYGLNDMTTDELIDQCKECKAHVSFAEEIRKIGNRGELI